MSFVATDRLCNLEGKVAIVTGAARGIGLGIARRLADAGASVVMSDISGATLEESSRQLGEMGHRVHAVAGDLTTPEGVDALVAGAVSAFGRIDILVNNAGLREWRKWEELSREDWDRFTDVNTKAVFFLSQAVGKVMVARGEGGAIVNIASTAAVIPVRFRVDYNTAKAAVIALTKSMALELGEHMIRVNAIGPGGTRSEGGSGAVPDWVKTSGSLNYMDRLAMPLGLLDPDDIARGVLFFCGDISRAVTGQTLFVDAGYLVG